MGTYRIITPSGEDFSVVAGDSDLAVMAANDTAKNRGIASCRAELYLGGDLLGEFGLEGCASKTTSVRTLTNIPVFDDVQFNTIAWHGYNEAGVPSGYSKRHLVDGDSKITLCGQKIPSSKEREVADGYAQSDDCKACARAAARR